MSDIAIRAEGLAKKYVIGHQSQSKDHTLRDLITASARSVLRKASDMIHGRPVIQGDNLEDVWALRDVGFEVPRGEVMGVIGRNGAGKSTLLKILSRIIEPTHGRVLIAGRVASLLEVGTGFHPELSGRENIFLNGAILGMSRAEIRRKFDEMVAFAEVEKFLDTPVKRYSSGMYVRLAFAVAAHLEPEILIIDEVLAVGDAAFQKRCLGKMQDVARGGRTVLFVSHNMPAVVQLCSSALYLKGGRVIRQGPASDVVHDYLSAGNTCNAEAAWTYPGDAPGDDRVRLLAARILQNGSSAPILDINAPAVIELDFEVLRPCRNLISGVSIYNASDLCLFNCCDWRPNNLMPGRYKKRMQLPAQTLAEGRFSALVQLVFFDPDVQSVVLPEAISFEGADSDCPTAVRGTYRGAWPGVMRLGLPWTEAAVIAAGAERPA